MEDLLTRVQALLHSEVRGDTHSTCVMCCMHGVVLMLGGCGRGPPHLTMLAPHYSRGPLPLTRSSPEIHSWTCRYTQFSMGEPAM